MVLETGRRTPLTRDRVLQAAICMADDGGIESLSMRKLGQALGVEAMSLYNHVANKDDILTGITDLVLTEFELPAADGDWEAAIKRCAISGHDALLRHPWACNLIMSITSVLPTRLQYMEAIMRCFRHAGFSADETSQAYHAIDSHVLGYTLWQLGHALPGEVPQITTKEELRDVMARFLPQVRLDDYPYVLEHAEQHFRERRADGETGYEFGLRLILEGLKRMRGAI
jgi:AcrR family transcriptional regulator